MAIAKKSLKKNIDNGAAECPPIEGMNSVPGDEPLVTLSAQGELAISPPHSKVSRLLRNPLQWLKKNGEKEVVQRLDPIFNPGQDGRIVSSEGDDGQRPRLAITLAP